MTSEERREAALEEQIAQEAARADVLEDEISAELKRQEELLHQIDREEPAPAPTPTPVQEQKQTATDPVTDPNLAERADPRVAPSAPKDRQLPLAIFEKEEVTIPAGDWGNDKKMKVVKRSLDADQDGTAGADPLLRRAPATSSARSRIRISTARSTPGAPTGTSRSRSASSTPTATASSTSGRPTRRAR